MSRLLFMIVVAGIIATSCSVKQEIEFNADYSGTNVFEVDYSELMSSMESLNGEMTTEDKSAASDKEIQKIEQGMEDMEGISNFKVGNDAENTITTLSYDFADVAALNNALNASKSEAPQMDFTVISLTNKQLVFDFWGSELMDIASKEEAPVAEDATDESSESSEAELSLGGIEDMFSMVFAAMEYEAVLHFPKPVKSINNELYTLSEDKRMVSLKVNMAEIIDAHQNLRLVVDL